MTVERQFRVHVRRKDADDTWIAWSGDERFEADSEGALKDRVRQHFLQRVADECNVPATTLATTVKHAWTLVITDTDDDKKQR